MNITVSDDGERLDIFLARECEISRSKASILIKDGFVRVNSRITKPHYKVKVGETIEVILPNLEIKPESIPLNIVYEDKDLIVIDKPAGLVCHPTSKIRQGTLVNGLLSHTNMANIGSPDRPGIVHRLDKDTSGLLVCAKTDEAYLGLSSQMKKRQIERRYKAVVWGILEKEGEISLPIGRPEKGGTSMKVGGRRMREAMTQYKVLERFSQASFIEAKLFTGRTHQIRVHLSAISHPVIGDKVYGKRRKAPIERQALHSFYLSFLHPITEKQLTFESNLPEDIRNLLVLCLYSTDELRSTA
ncbi:MAG: RluA family pseudouridine synthase [bacterium]|nr:RluA family pseudouridine synthase [bacterium]